MASCKRRTTNLAGIFEFERLSRRMANVQRRGADACQRFHRGAKFFAKGFDYWPRIRRQWFGIQRGYKYCSWFSVGVGNITKWTCAQTAPDGRVRKLLQTPDASMNSRNEA